MLQEQARCLEVEIPAGLFYPAGCLKSPATSTCCHSYSDDGIQRGAHRGTVVPAFLCVLGANTSFDLNEKSLERQECGSISATLGGRKARRHICPGILLPVPDIEATDPSPC